MNRLPPLDPSSAPRERLPLGFFVACQRTGTAYTPAALLVSIARQRMWLLTWDHFQGEARKPGYTARRAYVISTSRYGIGEVSGSNMTPRGLHRVGRKIGGGWPEGTVFKSRQVVGFTWQGLPNAPIIHRIFWLEGLEPGFNRGGRVDTFDRYIYIHGFGDEPTLGRPASHGCVHVSARDLIPLYDALPEGTLVWISER